MLQRIRNSFYTKVVAVYMAFSLVGDIIYPAMTYGLTSGPIDINQASFEPASTSEMVNLANGDFTYNIPLMDVDGYPINIAYHGGISMEQEASMVGLGWTLNVGAMNRIKKGLPDDFNGDEIKTTMNLRPRTSIKASIGIGAEIVGGEVEPNEFNLFDILTPTLGLERGVTFNNYYGYGLDLGGDVGTLIGNSNTNYNLGLGLGVNSSSQNGLSITPYANLSVGVFKGDNAAIQGKIGIGFTINSLQGLQTISTTTGIGIKPGDEGGISEGVKTSGNIPVSTISYTPSISFETNSNSINFDFDFGYELPIWATVHGKGTFSRSSTCLQQNVSTAKGYGYLYEHHKNENDNYLMDFNRDGRVIPNEHIAYLPITNHTFDVFNATAQGVGFSSRAFRSDVLAVSDPKKNDFIGGFGASGEVSVGTAYQAGLNLNFVSGYIQTGKWLENNPAADEFVKNSNPNQLYEHAYFKKFGNRSTANSNFYSTLFYDLPLKQSIDGTSGQSGLAQFETEFGSTFDFSTMNHYKTERDLRNTSIEYFTTNEAESFGLEDNINSYSIDETNGYNYGVNGYSSTIVNRNGLNIEDLKEHHIGEMSVLKGDGSRYVYGIPVVNTKTYEVMFNVSDHSSMTSDLALTKDCKTGLVSYNPNVDNSMDNRRGDNNLFIKKEIPASANSFLLSAYLSSNYIDRTQDGPTPDDLGNYTKFNYAKMSQNTKWRFPYEENTAMYNPGLQSDEYDDMGSYLYGEREQWYLHSIESKNFVAEFHYSDRADGRGVIDENGGVDNSTGAASKKLDYIALYTIEGKKNGEAPIKTVHFEYNYELCPNVPNSINTTSGDNGKLSLQAIYFTYGNSQKGKLHKYTFDYSNYNPSYSLGETDRWGGYSPANANASCGETGGLNQFEYPYANQNKTEADLNASAWMLNTIHLPSGSQINIDVEADDYSYLQDKLPSKMFKVAGLSINGSYGNIINNPNEIYNLFGSNNFLHVDLDQEITGSYSSALQEFIDNYIKNLNKIYFKFLVSVTRREFQGTSDEKFDYISGYAEIDKNNISIIDTDNNSMYDMAVIKLKGVNVEDKYQNGGSTNPVSKAAWQMIRKYMPRVLNPTVGSIYTDNDSRPYGYNCDVDESLPVDTDNTDPSPSALTNNEGVDLQDIYNIGVSQNQSLMSYGGINNMFKAQGFASKFVPEKSWIRLYQGSSHKKIGGGHRVKEISVNDNWNNVKNIEQSSQYGTVYNYETINEGNDYGEGTIISSGVASYEPISAGADENTFRSPEEYTINVLFRVNDEEFQEKPIGESIFASPNVVYSKVTVKNINYSGIEQDATGHTEYEFYTAKDFPTASKAKSTGKANVGKLEDNNSIIEALLGINYNYLTMSQGYSINVNDMHGKFKSKTVKSSGISPVEIYYLGHKYYQNGNELNNFMTVVNEDGVISNRNMGKDIDMVLDLTYSNSYSESITGQFGIDVGSFPVPIPSFWTSTSSQNSTFQSSVTTKVVYSNGILEEVELRDKGRTKKTKNVLFDAKTGVPVVSEIITESEPTPANPNLPEPIKIYQYDYPAYWAYNGMGLASENWGATFDGTNFYNGSTGIVNTQNTPFLNPGDEIGVLNSTNQSQVNKYWVVEDESNPGSYYLQDKLGNVIASGFNTSDYVFKVVKSGNKNLLGSTFMSITSLDNNINTTTTNNVVTAYSSPYDGSISHSRILNASAVEYTEKASTYASNDCGNDDWFFQGVVVGEKVNPYIQGMLGNWNLLASYVLDVERDQTINNIREDGTLSNYVAYWVNNSNSKWVKNVDPTVAEKWITAAIATLFDGEGYNLESKDALGIYSSILLGYNNTLKIAEAVNARYYEVAFDGFEDRDYDPLTCSVPEKHFSVVGDIANEGHTGRHSLSISSKNPFLTIPITNSIDESVTIHGKPFTVSGSDLIDPFTFIISEIQTKKYVFTAWIKGYEIVENTLGYASGTLFCSDPSVNIIAKPRSNIIDGWQRVEYVIEFPPQTISSPSTVDFTLGGGQTAILLDDIRIQPYNSEMVSYVIDPISLRLWATLDSRNFATFYQYDEEGSLVRIIQETEKGKVTVQENRAGIRIH